MKPIKFSNSNRTLLKPSDMSDEECSFLDVYASDKPCIYCWKMSRWERLSCFLFGKIWVYVLGGDNQPPMLSFQKDIFGK